MFFTYEKCLSESVEASAASCWRPPPPFPDFTAAVGRLLSESPTKRRRSRHVIVDRASSSVAVQGLLPSLAQPAASMQSTVQRATPACQARPSYSRACNRGDSLSASSASWRCSRATRRLHVACSLNSATSAPSASRIASRVSQGCRFRRAVPHLPAGRAL